MVKKSKSHKMWAILSRTGSLVRVMRTRALARKHASKEMGDTVKPCTVVV